jgi:hypothetical protein
MDEQLFILLLFFLKDSIEAFAIKDSKDQVKRLVKHTLNLWEIS